MGGSAFVGDWRLWARSRSGVVDDEGLEDICIHGKTAQGIRYTLHRSMNQPGNYHTRTEKSQPYSPPCSSPTHFSYHNDTIAPDHHPPLSLHRPRSYHPPVRRRTARNPDPPAALFCSLRCADPRILDGPENRDYANLSRRGFLLCTQPIPSCGLLKIKNKESGVS
jgi:hypothetical protein